jgi:hypothetical protein
MAAMKRVLLLAATLLVSTAASTQPARATEVGTSRSIGLGVQLFDPTALIGKVFLDRNDALDFGFGFWGYGTCYDANGHPYYCNNSANYYSIHFDYLYEENIVDQVVRLDWHAGAGGRTIFWGYDNNTANHYTAILARAPIGLDLTFKRPHWLEVYLEIAPAIQLAPNLDFKFDVGLGGRAYF